MTIFTEWIECPFPTGNKKIWMKYTPTNHGVIIQHPSLGGLKPGETKISPRRISVVESENGVLTAIIGAISYYSGYDTLNETDELFEQYVAGNFEQLMSATGLTVAWDGSSQELVRIFQL